MSTKETQPMPHSTADVAATPINALSTADVAAILGEERAKRDREAGREADPKPLAPKTVSQYLVESAPNGKYADRPFPSPAGRFAGRPYWSPSQVEDIRAWARSGPGPGVGGGRPWPARGTKEHTESVMARLLRKQTTIIHRRLLDEHGVTEDSPLAADLYRQAEEEAREAARAVLGDGAGALDPAA